MVRKSQVRTGEEKTLVKKSHGMMTGVHPIKRLQILWSRRKISGGGHEKRRFAGLKGLIYSKQKLTLGQRKDRAPKKDLDGSGE